MASFIIDLDARFVEYLYSLRDPNILAVLVLITKLGDWSLVIPVAAISGALLIYFKRIHLAAGLAVSLIGAFVTSTAFQMLLQRARPPEEFHAVIESSYTFPSRHATVAIALYGFLMYVNSKLTVSPPLRKLISLALFLVIVLLGFSRIYLGVHYPTDVLGGYIIGYLFMLIGIHAARKLEK